MSVIDEYLKNATPPQRKELNRIRRIAKEIVPEAEEVKSYGIPTLKYRGKYLIYFAAFKNHMSVFAIINPVREKLKKDYKVSKGTVQFTEAKPLPEDILREMVELRRQELEVRSR